MECGSVCREVLSLHADAVEQLSNLTCGHWTPTKYFLNPEFKETLSAFAGLRSRCRWQARYSQTSVEICEPRSRPNNWNQTEITCIATSMNLSSLSTFHYPRHCSLDKWNHLAAPISPPTLYPRTKSVIKVFNMRLLTYRRWTVLTLKWETSCPSVPWTGFTTHEENLTAVNGETTATQYRHPWTVRLLKEVRHPFRGRDSEAYEWVTASKTWKPANIPPLSDLFIQHVVTAYQSNGKSKLVYCFNEFMSAEKRTERISWREHKSCADLYSLSWKKLRRIVRFVHITQQLF